jgi:prevent-host-death family protein
MIISATEFKNKFGTCLMNVAAEPVIINKSGNNVAVMLSYNYYTRLVDLENKMLVDKAIEAAKEGFFSEEESLKAIGLI